MNRRDGIRTATACRMRRSSIRVVKSVGVSVSMSPEDCRWMCVYGGCASGEAAVIKVYDDCYNESICSAGIGRKANHDSGCTMSLCGTCAIQFKDDCNKMFCQYIIYNIYSHNGLQHRENITWICPVGAEYARRREETSVAVHGIVSSCEGSANSGDMYNGKTARMAACGIVHDAYDGKEYGKSPDTSVISAMRDDTCPLYVSSCEGFL